MANFTKIVNPGKVACGKINRQLFAEISFADGRLSIYGVIGPKSNGNAWGACGQIQDELSRVAPANGWDSGMVEKFQKIWNRWHLNDLRAGTPKQMRFLEGLESHSGPVDYESAVEAMKEAGIYEDEDYIWNGKPYRYGSAWLKEEVPADVVEWLQNLPESAVKPAWV